MPKGIEVRHGKGGGSIRLHFSYKGRECRELLKLEPTRANIAYAERLRGEVLNEIERGTFDYAKRFPRSKAARRMGLAAGAETVEDRLTAFIKRCELAKDRGNLALSTYRMYEQIVRCQLVPEFGKLRLPELTPALIREWVAGMGTTAKTTRNRLIPLRLAMAEAEEDGAVPFNPVGRVKIGRVLGLTAKASEWEVEPFTAAEVAAILAHAGPHRALFAFAFATGLRTSELIALEWRDIDLKAGKAHICRALVSKALKGPKTAAGDRVIDLSARAAEAIRAAGTAGGRVWINPNTRAPYAGDKPLRMAWGKILKAAGVKYRNPYQTRHTFASTLLSAGVNTWYVAQQMGHASQDMISRHYGRWLPGNDPFAQMSPEAFGSLGV